MDAEIDGGRKCDRSAKGRAEPIDASRRCCNDASLYCLRPLANRLYAAVRPYEKEEVAVGRFRAPPARAVRLRSAGVLMLWREYKTQPAGRMNRQEQVDEGRWRVNDEDEVAHVMVLYCILRLQRQAADDPVD